MSEVGCQVNRSSSERKTGEKEREGGSNNERQVTRQNLKHYSGWVGRRGCTTEGTMTKVSTSRQTKPKLKRGLSSIFSYLPHCPTRNFNELQLDIEIDDRRVLLVVLPCPIFACFVCLFGMSLQLQY